GGQHRDRGREREQPPDRRARAELLLEQQLPDVGHRLQDPERADAVGPVAVLEAAEQLALGQQRDRDQVEDDREDHDPLQQLDPPVLVVADLGEDGHALRTSTIGSVRALAGWSCVPAAMNTEPPGTAARSLTAPLTRVPLEPTSTWSPSRMPSRSASTGESSTTCRGRRKRSDGETSTSLELHSERNVPRRSAPSEEAGTASGTSSSTGSQAGASNAEAASVAGQRTPRPPIASSVSPA